MLPAEHAQALPEFFADIPDPRRSQGRRHPLPTVLAICAAAVLCGMRGYKAISLWAQDLSQQARARFRCRYRNHRYETPSRNVIREALAIDGKTMRNAIDENGRQTHILGVVGHQTQSSYSQKKSALYP